MTAKCIPHKLYVWDAHNSHDWPTWMRMVDIYL
jgi:esterase/lipase superfamily enzyme